MLGPKSGLRSNCLSSSCSSSVTDNFSKRQEQRHNPVWQHSTIMYYSSKVLLVPTHTYWLKGLITTHFPCQLSDSLLILSSEDDQCMAHLATSKPLHAELEYLQTSECCGAESVAGTFLHTRQSLPCWTSNSASDLAVGMPLSCPSSIASSPTSFPSFEVRVLLLTCLY